MKTFTIKTTDKATGEIKESETKSYGIYGVFGVNKLGRYTRGDFTITHLPTGNNLSSIGTTVKEARKIARRLNETATADIVRSTDPQEVGKYLRPLYEEARDYTPPAKAKKRRKIRTCWEVDKYEPGGIALVERKADYGVFSVVKRRTSFTRGGKRGYSILHRPTKLHTMHVYGLSKAKKYAETLQREAEAALAPEVLQSRDTNKAATALFPLHKIACGAVGIVA